jgi:hypothetical protein
MASVCQQIPMGQKVGVKELDHGCEITLLPADQPGPTVIEVAPDYLVLEDAVAEIQTRIPTYLIKAVRDPSAPEPAAAPPMTPPAVEVPNAA